ncbi:MAG: cupin domain-containing protein [Desulfobacteraceae bacterium]|nr:cupin domain-containing protein [Desulfobacteraceae bacterium]
MPLIHKISEIEQKKNNSPISDFSWKSSLPLGEISKSKYLHFDIKSLLPGKFSYPYHFHRNAEELFVILEGEATLRSKEGYQTIEKGDVIFFEEGPEGAHQLCNHSDEPFVYVDLCTKANVDVCEYPDSCKINILPAMDIFEEGSKVSYYDGEDGVKSKWPEELLKNK